MAGRVTTLIRQQFENQIAACRRLEDYVIGLTKEWPGRPIEQTADGLIHALLARSLDTYSCAVRLASDGYGTQASMLNRSLFEDMVDAHWIASDPEAAQKRYSDHHDHGRMLPADAAQKYPEHYTEVALPEFDADERKRLDEVYGEYGSKPWSTISLHRRVELIDHHWTTAEAKRTLRLFRDIAHRENNQTLHVSAASLNAVVRSSEEGSIGFNVGPRLDMVDRALLGAFWTFAQTAGLIVDHFDIAIDDQSREDLFSAVDFLT
jgi:hypothetical protein